MIIDNKFEEILINPALKGADNLIIFSGYSSPPFINSHLNELSKRKLNINVDLYIGMGARRVQHYGFIKNINEKLNFNCSYYKSSPLVHSKIYLWKKKDRNIVSFLGSSNYSNEGFFETQQGNIMMECDPDIAESYISKLTESCINANEIVLKPIETKELKKEKKKYPKIDNKIFNSYEDFTDKEIINLDLLIKKNKKIVMPTRSGLNWGQRPEYNRKPNQGYIAVRKKELESTHPELDFFPQKEKHFIVFTDDKKEFFAVMGGNMFDKGKASKVQKLIGKNLETPKVDGKDNAWLGLYFRERLGVKSGEPITKEDLENYGRTDVTFVKIDSDSFYLDFSV